MPRNKRHPRTAQRSLLGVVLPTMAALALLASVAQADPAFGTMNDSGGIYWRSAPDWNTPEQNPGVGIYPGTDISVHCYQSGTTVPGSADTMWVQASWVSGPGSGSGWVDEHFVNDGQPINQAAPGVPSCASLTAPQQTANPQPATVNPQGPTVNPQSGSGPGPSQPAGPTAAERAAVSWATPFAANHLNRYAGLCLTFVDLAYQAAGVNLRSEITVRVGANTYPLDIWGHLRGQTGGGTPPYGALVFFEPKSGSASYRRDYSHVVLSIGGGNLISTEDSVNGDVHYETMAQHSYAVYLGWWLPA